jgi:hypothetical protein
VAAIPAATEENASRKSQKAGQNCRNDGYSHEHRLGSFAPHDRIRDNDGRKSFGIVEKWIEIFYSIRPGKARSGASTQYSTEQAG